MAGDPALPPDARSRTWSGSRPDFKYFFSWKQSARLWERASLETHYRSARLILAISESPSRDRLRCHARPATRLETLQTSRTRGPYISFAGGTTRLPQETRWRCLTLDIADESKVLFVRRAYPEAASD